jgi:hypothetical protein
MLPEVETGRFSQVIIDRIVVNLSDTQSVSKARIFSKTSFCFPPLWRLREFQQYSVELESFLGKCSPLTADC